MEDALNRDATLDFQDTATIEVVEPWLNLATIIQIIGLGGTLVSSLTLIKTNFLSKRPDDLAKDMLRDSVADEVHE